MDLLCYCCCLQCYWQSAVLLLFDSHLPWMMQVLVAKKKKKMSLFD
jgi:hypothetical protein